MKKKMSQSRMFETVVVIIVFFMLVAAGFVIYINVQKGAIRGEIKEAKELRAAKIAKTVMGLPELQCSKAQAVESCVDKLKVDAFRSYAAQNQNKYFDLLGYSEIKTQQIYPEEKPADTIYSKPKSGASKKSIWLPVAIFYPEKDATAFGILTVDVYE